MCIMLGCRCLQIFSLLQLTGAATEAAERAPVGSNDNDVNDFDEK